MTDIFQKQNNLAEDLGAIIGFCNTLMLCSTRGGKKFYVPKQVSKEHLLHKLIGAPAFARLVDEFGGESIDLPSLADFDRFRRIRRCAELFLAGQNMHQIASETGVSYQQAKNDRQRAEQLGLIPLVLHGKPVVDCIGKEVAEKQFALV